MQNTEALKKSFQYRGAVLRNGISVKAKQATILNGFRVSLIDSISYIPPQKKITKTQYRNTAPKSKSHTLCYMLNI